MHSQPLWGTSGKEPQHNIALVLGTRARPNRRAFLHVPCCCFSKRIQTQGSFFGILELEPLTGCVLPTNGALSQNCLKATNSAGVASVSLSTPPKAEPPHKTSPQFPPHLSSLRELDMFKAPVFSALFSRVRGGPPLPSPPE